MGRLDRAKTPQALNLPGYWLHALRGDLQLALVYQEAVASRDPRVTRLGLQILWRNLRDVMEAGAE